MKVDASANCVPFQERVDLAIHLDQIEAIRVRLFAGGAGIHVDFHAHRHFDDLRRFPGHFGSPWSKPDELRPADKLIRVKSFAQQNLFH
jgi:hypothetical protein